MILLLTLKIGGIFMGVGYGIIFGFIAWFFLRYILTSFFTVNQNERAVKTSFGKAKRLKVQQIEDLSKYLNSEEASRYDYPQVEVIKPGGPYFKWPWEKIHKVSVSTRTVNMAYDPENPNANNNNQILDAVTKDQLNIGLSGQIRYRVSENNLYAYIFGVKNPIAHVMGYFVSVLRERIANFETPEKESEYNANDIEGAHGISINDLRKNLRDLNDHMDLECKSSAARYGVILEASLITGIDPPSEVESALAAINTAHNEVSSNISLAQATADQRIVESKRAVEIQTLKAEAEVETLNKIAGQLKELKNIGGSKALKIYIRNIKLGLFDLTKKIIREEKS